MHAPARREQDCSLEAPTGQVPAAPLDRQMPGTDPRRSAGSRGCGIHHEPPDRLSVRLLLGSMVGAEVALGVVQEVKVDGLGLVALAHPDVVLLPVCVAEVITAFAGPPVVRRLSRSPGL